MYLVVALVAALAGISGSGAAAHAAGGTADAAGTHRPGARTAHRLHAERAAPPLTPPVTPIAAKHRHGCKTKASIRRQCGVNKASMWRQCGVNKASKRPSMRRQKRSQFLDKMSS